MTDHPLFYRKNVSVLFLVVWIAITVIHAWWLTAGAGVLASMATLDTLVYNPLFMILAVAMWFPMRALYQTRTGNLTLAGGYLLLVATILSLWLLSGNGILMILRNNTEELQPILSPLAPWRIITGFFYTLVMIMVYYLILYYEELREKTTREAELKSMMAETEIKALKAQLNPHFLFNTLNTMGNLLNTDPERASDMLVKLSQFLRYSLTHEEKQFVPVSRELEYVSDYVSLIRMRFGEKVTFAQEIEESCTTTMIPVMILQPLVENAVRYSLSAQKPTGMVRLTCRHTEGEIILSVKNRYDPEVPEEKGHGIGLKNIRKRLSLVYGKDDLLQIQQKEDIFEVILRLPVKEEPDAK